MQETNRCWVCHRDVVEILASVDVETQEEKELKKQMTQVAWYKSKFTESAELWRRGLPREFKDMDFQFVASNAEQFSSIKTLAEVLDAKKLLLDWLADASSRLRVGGEGISSDPELSALDIAERDSILKSIDQFEAKWHRSLVKDGRSNGYASGFEGLKLFDGLEFVIAEGLFYYDVRSQLSQIAMVKATAKKPKKSIRMLQANGYPPVPLCSVCESLIMGLRAPERKRQEPLDEASEPELETVSQQAPQREPPIAVVQATAAVVTEGISPTVAEVLQKMGPASKEAPKMRSLHEHRLKEDWDEIVEKPKEA